MTSPGWAAPSYDVLVIGAGLAGLTAATPARDTLSARYGAWKSRSTRKPTTSIGSSERRSPAAIVAGTTADGRAAPTAVGRRRFSPRSPV